MKEGNENDNRASRLDFLRSVIYEAYSEGNPTFERSVSDCKVIGMAPEQIGIEVGPAILKRLLPDLGVTNPRE